MKFLQKVQICTSLFNLNSSKKIGQNYLAYWTLNWLFIFNILVCLFESRILTFSYYRHSFMISIDLCPFIAYLLFSSKTTIPFWLNFQILFMKFLYFVTALLFPIKFLPYFNLFQRFNLKKVVMRYFKSIIIFF